MKKILLIFVLMPVFFWSQSNTLVKWYSKTANNKIAATSLEEKVTAEAQGFGGVSVKESGNSNDPFYNLTGWPGLELNAALDATKYIQFKISPQSNYSLSNIKFNFKARAASSDTSQLMEVKFSKDGVGFTNSSVLQAATHLPANSAYGTYNLSVPATIASGEVLYIRIYVYNTWQAFQIQHDATGVNCPTITGDISVTTPLKPVANNDLAGILQNDLIADVIDILANDVYHYYGPLTLINITTPPLHGAVTVNGVKDVSYIPTAGYVGYDSFKYTLTNSVGTSLPVEVDLQVIPFTGGAHVPLVRWNKGDFSATSYSDSTSGDHLTVVGGNLKLTHSGNTFHIAGKFPSPRDFDSSLDPTQYVALSITDPSINKIDYLQSFKMKYKSTGNGNITMRYSTSKDFSGTVHTLFNNLPFTSVFSETESNFPEGTVLYPGEHLYLRIYIYNTDQNTFDIDFIAGGAAGPTIMGVSAVIAKAVGQTASAPSSNPAVCFTNDIPPVTIKTTNATGIGTPTGLPEGLGASWVGNTITITGVPATSGTFTYSIPVLPSAEVNAKGTITVGGTSTYSSDGWSDGGVVPNSAILNAIITSDYTTEAGISMLACNCTVDPIATLTIASGTHVTLTDNLTNNGKVVVKNDGNFIQVNDQDLNSGAGIFTVERDARMKRLDYTYWGSPVKQQNLKAFSPGTVETRFLTYNESNDFFDVINPGNNVFGNNKGNVFESAAKGYAIRASNYYPVWTTAPIEADYRMFPGKFTGKPNNGDVSFPLKKTGNGYNLVGNPYPSNIDFNTLAATGVIEGTAYFWTNVNPNVASQGSNYNGINYATLTLVGGVPATNGSLVSSTPTRFIKVGQGFIVKAIAASDLIFTNAMRNEGKDESRFVNKSNATSFSSSNSIDRFWLKLTTPAQNFNTILIAYVDGATNGFESFADAQQMGESSDSFYSILGDRKLNIQGRQFPLFQNDAVPLGLKGFEAGMYEIAIVEKEGIFGNGQNVYLKDHQTGTITNISESSYTFFANEGLTDGRFEIVYQNDFVLGTVNTTKDAVIVYRDGNDFVVKSSTKTISEIEVYDASGRLLYKLNTNHKEVRIDSSDFINGVYVLRITSASFGEQKASVVMKKVLK